MAWLDVYTWEHEKFPEEQKVLVPAELRIPLAQALARHMGIRLVSIDLTTRGGGRAWPMRLLLPAPAYDCKLGTIYHEIAHAYNSQRFKGDGHTGTFKKALIHVYVEGRQSYEKLMGEAQRSADHEKALLTQRGAKEMALAERKQAAKAMRQTREFKMERLKARIKRLESRQKRIATLLKSAHRSLKAYERYSKENQNGIELRNQTANI